MVRVKICGITRVQDAIAAAEAGADAIGLVFAKSPRRVSVLQARRIVAALPPLVSAVGVFVNEKPEAIRTIAQKVGLSAVQLHGDESPRIVELLRPLRVIKAIRVRNAGFVKEMQKFASARVSAILLDAHSKMVYGGTGKTVDWRMIRKVLSEHTVGQFPLQILAGGLNSRNVGEAIATIRPWGVDVSGGVESGPGIKSKVRLREFIASARGK
jgi:phosphoribosylanthranilate isomerase